MGEVLAMLLPPTGIGEVLCAIGLLDTAAPLPELTPAGNVGSRPVGLGADWALRVELDGTTLVAERTRCWACTAVAAAQAHSRAAAARRVRAGMTRSWGQALAAADAGGRIPCSRFRAARPSRGLRHLL
jgi:hypothetical protein